MTEFIAIATVMVAIALAWLLWPLLRSVRRPEVERHVANASIYGDQFADLDADLRRGTISEASYVEARSELERRLLDEGRAPGGNAIPVRSHRATAIVVALAVPLVAGLMYWKLGAPDAFSPMATATTAPDASHQMTPEQLDGMVQQLAARLDKEPQNVEGWVILARTYYTMRKFPEAAAAYEKLTQLVPDEPDLLADYADALAMSQGRDLGGRPLELVQAALKIDPTHWKALAMAGTAAFDRKDYKGAVDYWERLRSSQPADSPIAQSIAASISEARKLGGLPPAPAMAAAPQKAAPAAMPPPVAAASSTGTAKGAATADRNHGRRHREPVRRHQGKGGTDRHRVHLCASCRRLAHAARLDAGEGIGAASQIHARRHDGDVEGHEAVDGALRRCRCACLQVRTADALQWRPRGAVQARRGGYEGRGGHHRSRPSLTRANSAERERAVTGGRSSAHTHGNHGRR